MKLPNRRFCLTRNFHAISHPARACWILGSGYRGTFEQLDARARAHVHAENLRFIREGGIVAVRANVVHAVAPKPR